MSHNQIPDEDKPFQSGQLVLFGSGETSPEGRKIFEEVFRTLPTRPYITLLETPSGFELNSPAVVGRISDFLAHSLQNYQPKIEILPARRRGSYFSPDNPEIVSPILKSDLIFMGPGSPTYAVRQMKDSLAWEYILARNLLEASLVLASSAVIAISSFALPVYEIFKVGEDLHWVEGLDLFKGMNMVFIPHWNNQDGGSELDTSCCFIGKSRFAELLDILPPATTVLGIDEQTALFFDFQQSKCRVLGKGCVTVIQPGESESNDHILGECIDPVVHKRRNKVIRYDKKSVIPMKGIFGDNQPLIGRGFSAPVWIKALAAAKEKKLEREQAAYLEFDSDPHNNFPEEIADLLNNRKQARKEKLWDSSDQIREKLNELGWDVLDTPEGQRVSLRDQPPGE